MRVEGSGTEGEEGRERRVREIKTNWRRNEEGGESLNFGCVPHTQKATMNLTPRISGGGT